jgi:hypothetical protein
MSSEKAHEAAARECQRLADKILLGLTSKRSDEEWEFYVERTITLFREKGLFKNESQAQPAPPPSNPQDHTHRKN